MQRRANIVRMILAGVVILGLAPLMAIVDAQAQIAFVSERDGNAEIYVMDTDGNNRRRLTENRSDDWSPSWSPDGKRIVFVSDRDEHPDVIPGWFNSEIYIMDADGSNPQNLTNNPADDRSPSWSPDGKRIVFSSNRDGFKNAERVITHEIYVMDVDGGNPQNLTNNLNNDSSPSWSPDGKRIVFSSVRDGHFENEFGITDEIYVMDADGGNPQRLTENPKNDWDPVWSPDGKRIAFAADRKGDLVNFEIYAMDANGENEQRLTENRSDDWSPSWSPNGERITFRSERDGNGEIYVIDADGGNPQNLSNNPHSDFGPAWLNSPFSVSAVGKKIMMWGWLKQVD